MLEDGGRHEIVIGNDLESPGALLIHWLNDGSSGSERQQRRPRFKRDIQHRHGHRGQRGTDQHVDLVLDHQPARVLDPFSRIRLVVQDDIGHLLSTDLFRKSGNRLELRLAQCGSRAACRNHDSNFDVRVSSMSIKDACYKKRGSRETDLHVLFLPVRFDDSAGCVGAPARACSAPHDTVAAQEACRPTYAFPPAVPSNRAGHAKRIAATCLSLALGTSHRCPNRNIAVAGRTAAFSRRDSPELCLVAPPSCPRGRREGRVPAGTRGPLREDGAQGNRTAAYRCSQSLGLPCAMVGRLMPCSPGSRVLFGLPRLTEVADTAPVDANAASARAWP